LQKGRIVFHNQDPGFGVFHHGANSAFISYQFLTFRAFRVFRSSLLLHPS
jgi:hypothetical protein